MDNEIRQLQKDYTPQINPDIAEGLAVKHIPYLEEYLDNIIRGVAKGFPSELEYLGCRRCTPKEEFDEATKKKNTKRRYDVARTDLYMIKLMFRFQGIDLPPRYIYLPYVSTAGTITIGGSRYIMSPVLSDKVISIGTNNIFVRLLRAKLTFERLPHNIMINDTRETVQIVWSLIYNLPANKKDLVKTVKAKCALMHYLFCKYGVAETFKRFGNCQTVIGYGEINQNSYPPDQFTIFRSTQIKPKGYGKGFWEPSGLRMAIRNEEVNEMVKSMVGGFFYVVDHFPTRLPKEYLESNRIWIVLMGHILFTGSMNEGTLYDDVSEHFRSLDEHIDKITSDQLAEIGYDVQDIYQLFAIVINNFNQWLIGSSAKVCSMYDKELSILYYIAQSIINAIHILHYRIRTASKKLLTDKGVINIMNATLKTGLIFAIVRQNACMTTVSYSGDNKFFKLTSILGSQTSALRPAGKKNRARITDPSKRLHVSLAEVGGYMNLPKSEPTGRSRINPHLKIDDRGMVLRNPELMNMLDLAQEAIERD